MAAAMVAPPFAQQHYHSRSTAHKNLLTSGAPALPSSYTNKFGVAVSTTTAPRSSRWPDAHNAGLFTGANSSIADLNTTSHELPNKKSSSQPALLSRLSDSKRRRRRGSKSGSFPSLADSYGEPFPHPPPNATSSKPSSTHSSTTKIRPYLRKMSGTKSKEDADQGRLDLSKSVAENDALNGLGISDHRTRSSPDMTFGAPPRAGHSRTISGGSQASVGSTANSYRANQPFVHPMRQTPRPYTPITGPSSINGDGSDDEEARERDDHVGIEDLRRGAGYRSGRSQSVTAGTSHFAPTPLAHMHTAPDLGVYASTYAASASQTNLSTHSTKSSRSRLAFFRRDTDRSVETTSGGTLASPPLRTSIDRTFSFATRRSDNHPDSSDAASGETAPMTHEERIRAARRAFEEREAQKEQKLAERRANVELRTSARSKRRGTTTSSISSSSSTHHIFAASPAIRTQSSLASLPPADPTAATHQGRRKLSKAPPPSSSAPDTLRAKPYEHTAPAPAPLATDEALSGRAARAAAESASDGHRPPARRRAETPQTGWVRFSTWAQTRMLGHQRS